MISPLVKLRNREVGKPQSRVFLLLLGATGLLAAIAMTYVGFNASKNVPGRTYFNIEAEFDEADLITRTAQVRIGAELVGQVAGTRVEDGKAILELQLEGDQAGALLDDSTLEVRPRSPIGVRYVDLNPGSGGVPLEEGDRIPASQTAATVPLDIALEAFDPKARSGAQTMFRALGNGFADRGGDINVALGGAPDLLADTRATVGALNDLDGATARFVKGAQGAAAAADPVRAEIAQGFEPEAEALEIFSEEETSLRGTLEAAPPALGTARAQLPGVRALVSEVGLLAQSAVPALDAAPGALTRTATLLRDSRPGLEDLSRTLSLLEEATDPTLELLRAIRPVLPNANDALRDSKPLAAELAGRGCDMRLFFTNWESMLGFETPKHGLLRLNVTSGDESVDGGTGETAPIVSNPYPEPCTVLDDKLPSPIP